MSKPRIKLGDLVRVRRPGFDDIDAQRNPGAYGLGNVTALFVLDAGEGWQPADAWHGAGNVLVSVALVPGGELYSDLSVDPTDFSSKRGQVLLPPVDQAPAAAPAPVVVPAPAVASVSLEQGLRHVVRCLQTNNMRYIGEQKDPLLAELVQGIFAHVNRQRELAVQVHLAEEER